MTLNVNADKIVKYFLDPDSGDAKIRRYDVSSDPYPDLSDTTGTEERDLEDISPVWEAGKRLHARDEADRTIYTTVDNGASIIDFNLANEATIAPFLGVGTTDTAYLGDAADQAGNLIQYVRGVDFDCMRSRTMALSRAVTRSMELSSSNKTVR